MRRNIQASRTSRSTTFVPTVALCLALCAVTGAVQAQGAPPPPPPPPSQPAATPAVAATSAPSPSPSDKEKEVLADLKAGSTAVTQLDLAAAQGYFEQAFAKCDAAAIKGPLLAKVYMALGSLYAGYLQQVPQGAEFMKLAFQNDPAVEILPEVSNSQVQATVQMVKETLGIAAPKVEEPQGPPSANNLGGFWVMRHTRVSQAKRMYPLGLWVETNPMVAVNGVRLYFRTPSDRQFTVGMMQKKGSQWGLLIDCSAIALLDPEKMFYYFEVIGGDNSIIGQEGSGAEPIEIQMIPDTEFKGQQPMLPGMPEPSKCNPDAAAPCPPWDPHCKDMACVSTEDCLSGKICSGGYCIDTGTGEEDDGIYKPIGLVIAAGVGMGAGFVSGEEDGFCGGNTEEAYESCGADSDNPVNLGSGLSPTWMHTRAMIGYYVLDNLVLGAWVRFQHLNDHEMKMAGLQIKDINKGEVAQETLYGPMWGLTASFFWWGDGRFLGPGQVKDESGALKDKQGLRSYARLEYDIYGAMYHELKLRPNDEHVSRDDGGTCVGDSCYKSTEHRQHRSGLSGVGLGVGALYGVHRHIDIGAELMYDLMFPDIANNFDLQLQMQFHF